MKRTILLLILALCLTLASFMVFGTSDVSIWLRWSQSIQAHGLIDGYRLAFPDYPPLCFVFLAVPTILSAAFGLPWLLLLKLLLLTALIVSTLFVYHWTKSTLIAIIAYLSLLLSSVTLGYLDVLTAPFLLIGCWLLWQRRFTWAFTLLLIASLIKWQPGLLLPFAAIYILRVTSWRTFIRAVLPSVVIGLVILAVFMLAPLNAFVAAFSQNMLSGYALNVNWIATYALEVKAGMLQNGRIEYIPATVWAGALVMKAVFAILYVYILGVLARKRRPQFEDFLNTGLLGFLTYIMFNTGVHENHYFTIALIAGVGFFIDHRWLRSALLWNIVANINLLLFYGVTGASAYRMIGNIDLSLPLAVAALGCYMWQGLLSFRYSPALAVQPQAVAGGAD